jgi:hypothetical protein
MNDETRAAGASSEKSHKAPDEMVRAPSNRADFLLWSLILAAALGATALSFGENAIPLFTALIGFALAILATRRSRWLTQAWALRADLPKFQKVHLGDLIRPSYTAAEFQALRTLLCEKGVFVFKSLPCGLFSAAGSTDANDPSGYQYVWVRDNVHVAHAHWICGDKTSAGRNLAALMTHFQNQRERFRAIINDRQTDPAKALAAEPMNRPHIRFNGRTLAEIDQPWGHAQNDALGYFLWCYCKLAADGVVQPKDADLECLADFPRYFAAIKYWADRDNGHWEEVRKVSASSIGTVVAGLREYERLLDRYPIWSALVNTKSGLDSNQLKALRAKGETALARILPCESIEPKEYYRRYDSAPLFLIYPLEVLDDANTARVLDDVRAHLQGDYGIRRYPGDSYWFPNYKKIIRRNRTGDFSGTMEQRDKHVRLGEEAQWCLFDPILSVIYGRKYRRCQQEGKTGEAEKCLAMQTAYFNRAVSQLAIRAGDESSWLAPEAYYLENGHYVPNDHTPLLWTQANLWLATQHMQQSIETKP